MQSTTCLPRPIPLSRPWPQRWLQTVGEALQSGLEGLQIARQQRSSRRCEDWDLSTIARLSDHTLRDIGAPEWLRAEAAALRDADHLSVMELRAGNSGLFDRGI